MEGGYKGVLVWVLNCVFLIVGTYRKFKVVASSNTNNGRNI